MYWSKTSVSVGLTCNIVTGIKLKQNNPVAACPPQTIHTDLTLASNSESALQL